MTSHSNYFAHFFEGGTFPVESYNSGSNLGIFLLRVHPNSNPRRYHRREVWCQMALWHRGPVYHDIDGHDPLCGSSFSFCTHGVKILRRPWWGKTFTWVKLMMNRKQNHRSLVHLNSWFHIWPDPVHKFINKS